MASRDLPKTLGLGSNLYRCAQDECDAETPWISKDDPTPEGWKEVDEVEGNTTYIRTYCPDHSEDK